MLLLPLLQVLEGLLPLFQAGQVQHVVAEVVPSWWAARGANTTRGLEVLNAMAAAASQTLLLDDGTPFQFIKQQVGMVLQPASPGHHPCFNRNGLGGGGGRVMQDTWSDRLILSQL